MLLKLLVIESIFPNLIIIGNLIKLLLIFMKFNYFYLFNFSYFTTDFMLSFRVM